MAKKPQKQETNKLGQLMRKAKRSFLYAFLFSFAMNAIMLLVPLYSLQVLDRVMSSHSLQTLFMLSVMVVSAILFYGIFSGVRTHVLSGIAEWLDRELAPVLLSEAVTRASLGVPTPAGQHQRDLQTLKAFITGGISTLLDAPWSILYILAVYLINPILGVICVIGLVLLLISGIVNEYATKKPFEESAQFAVKSQQQADIASRNAEAVEAMGMMPNVLRSWERYHQQSMGMQRIAGNRATIIQTISRVMRYMVQIAVTGFGGYLVLLNEMTVGGMIAGSILVGRALAPFEGAIAVWKSFISARDAYHRLGQTLGVSEKIDRGVLDLPQPEGRLNVENLIYTPANAAPIIKGINFVVQPGEALGIIGPSGAGKSTLSKLIVGLLPPTHGAVRLDGAETFKWKRENFGKYIGYLPQHVDLFDGTIKDNIARMDTNASMDSVIEAAKKAHAHELILRLPNGYETECGIANLSLSPGQKQRVGLARALYGNPCFILLDEPNSNLDGEGERALLAALRDLKQHGITSVLVAHRPTIVSMVDKLLVLKSGTIERFGAREEVLKYYVAANAQQEKVA